MSLIPDLFRGLGRRFWQCRRGTVIVVFSLVLPLLAIGSVGVAEVAEVMLTKTKLQRNVDAAAIQGAGEFGVDQSTATVERTRLYADGMAEPLRLRWTVASTAAIDAAARTVTVRQTANRASFFGNLLPPGGWNLAATATAIRTARKPLCVLGSQGTGAFGSPASVELQANSMITASDCLVQSNANMAAGAATTLWAGEARAAGSASGPIRPAAVTDAPAMADPFAAMRIDVPLLCDSLSLSLGSGTFYLNPGVHCGAITLLGTANLVLAPGDHYFLGPSLSVGGQSTITGSDVVVILKGLLTAQVTGSAVLQLEGRKSGPYAGFVLITDRSYSGDVGISTNNARKLIGTVYLPNASLTVDGNNNKVADQSPWTVVVARTIRTQGSANLTINSNYNSSTVPVPAGVGPQKDQPVRLAQ
ncbi:TadE/TadG family type IV pilus assembly protein [Methylobacterium nonmethylotrophicum]|uniref:Pilus assembly protein n=1 Tax=Methylobacterium nonmethylotrophicum TaxID=1141884 RepID=A0A4Z0NFZ6_9HYPH|nr:TadE/TadG family type IV pilus assembly protein [Methylobacterium nonmethylotrophicum]TGD94676.1 pilus assembly protein [Methylobacterium nonmethylotrophicum]